MTSTGPLGSSIEIDAPPVRVWEIASDERNDPRWSTHSEPPAALASVTVAGAGVRRLTAALPGARDHERSSSSSSPSGSLLHIKAPAEQS